VQRPFGLPLAALKAHVGERIQNHENMPRLVVDQYGNALQSVTRATGDATRTFHDAFLAALANSLKEVGIKFKGGGRSSSS
jgi:predicted nucleic acid-binding Zn ribbon protein